MTPKNYMYWCPGRSEIDRNLVSDNLLSDFCVKGIFFQTRYIVYRYILKKIKVPKTCLTTPESKKCKLRGLSRWINKQLIYKEIEITPFFWSKLGKQNVRLFLSYKVSKIMYDHLWAQKK